ncbi:MAG: serine hydrolase [Solirubrobacterales bacterium]|nr:serine hydrolase [Solirubrobacterales bacterium]
MINYRISERRVFSPPGTSWAFSDTNFVLLGEVLRRLGGRPLPQLLRAQIFDKLGLRQTANSTSSGMPSPVLHGYTSERGVYEDATFGIRAGPPTPETVTPRWATWASWFRPSAAGRYSRRLPMRCRWGPRTSDLGPSPRTSSIRDGPWGEQWVDPHGSTDPRRALAYPRLIKSCPSPGVERPDETRRGACVRGR